MSTDDPIPPGQPASAATTPVRNAGPGRARSRDRGPGDGNMLPGRQRRRFGIERLLVRLIATGGIIGIGVALGAILTSNKTSGWIIGLVIAVVSIVLSAVLWSSRQV